MIESYCQNHNLCMCIVRAEKIMMTGTSWSKTAQNYNCKFPSERGTTISDKLQFHGTKQLSLLGKIMGLNNI